MGLEPESAELNSVNPLVLAATCARLRKTVRDFRPDIVNCHRGEGFALWAALRRFHAFGLVRTRGDQRRPKANYPNILLHAKLADAVIATSSGIAGSARTVLRVPEDRLHTLFGGVDTRRFFPDPAGRAAMREAWGLGPEETAIGLVGRFDAVKGQKELIAAFARLRRELAGHTKPPRLVLAGFATSSTSEDAVRGWARAAGIADRVIFPGRCEDVRGLMNALDLGVVASLGSETIARAALEIMACGTPLVGTSVGVMPDLLEPEALVPPGDTGALAGVLRRFMEDPSFMGRLRFAQSERMRTLRESDFLEQTLAVYREVLARKK